MFEDIRTIRRNDPAARNALEILLCYPGLHALWSHRLAHRLWTWKLPVVPRFISHLTRWLTGIEIHPGARIGRRVFIDHGMGVVIGETAEVGDDCLIYQGATLGGTSLKPEKRHPTLESNVVVGSGAKVLGNITIGHHSLIGSGSVVIHSSPPHSTIVGIPGRIVTREKKERPPVGELEHQRLPDIVAQTIAALHQQVEDLRRQIAELHARPITVTLPPGLKPVQVQRAFEIMVESAEESFANAADFHGGEGI